MAMYMFHLTRDGEYIDGVTVTNIQFTDMKLLSKLSASYEGCQAWAYTTQWYSKPAAGLTFGRWQAEDHNYVPECVRVAEYVRDKS